MYTQATHITVIMNTELQDISLTEMGVGGEKVGLEESNSKRGHWEIISQQYEDQGSF